MLDIGKELRNDENVTLELLWQEYKTAEPGGYGYSRFCDLFPRFPRTGISTALAG